MSNTPQSPGTVMGNADHILTVIKELETANVLHYAKTAEYIARLRTHAEMLRGLISPTGNEPEDEEEGCGLDSDTCGMEFTPALNDEQHVKQIKSSLSRLDSLI